MGIVNFEVWEMWFLFLTLAIKTMIAANYSALPLPKFIPTSMKKFFLATIILGVLASPAFAQDKHFTQFYAAPLSLNPALTGAMQGGYRVGSIYRDQWRKVLDNPIKTFSIFADLRFESRRKKNSDDALGLGIMFFNDKVSVVDFSTTQIAVSLAYHKALDANSRQFLSFGVQGGLTQRNVNYGSLKFHDQFNGNGSYSGQTDEELPGNNFAYSDFNAGLNYTAAIGRTGRFFAGTALHHFLQPQISFYDNEKKGDKLLTKVSAQMSANLPLTNDNRVQIHPRLLMALQGPHMEVNAGTNFRFAMGQYGSSAMHFGTWLRPVRNSDGFGLDAVVALVGLELNNMLFGLSYDLNLKALQANQRQGSFEVSVTYLGNYNNEEIICPKF
jgi:type IX secretion system PorP/SprF family membrane protein